MLKNKQDIFGIFSSSNCRFRKNSGHGNDSLHDSFVGSCPVIDASFVEVSEGPVSEEDDSAELDSELLENLREYLRTRSKEEITEIFEEIRKTLKSRYSEDEFSENHWENPSAYEKIRIKEIPGRAVRTFSKTVCCGKDQIFRISKTVSSKASTIASEGKESVKISSKKLNDRWSNLSPRDRKMISEVLITAIEIGLLRKSTRGKRAAFGVLSSIYRHQTLGRRDLEELMDEVSRRFKRRY